MVAPSFARIEQVSQHLFSKLRGYFAVTDEIEGAISSLCTDLVTFAPRDMVIRQGDAYRHIYLVESGWVLRARHLPQGTRQFVNLAMRGDFLCFNASLFGTSDFDLMAKTQVTAFRFERIGIRELFRRFPSLALALAWSNAHEESMLAERLVSLGRRNAMERMAHVLCELAVRMKIVGLMEDGILPIPLTQEEFADLLGMSLIHVNRTFRRLAGAGLVAYRAGEVRIVDFGRLALAAGFDAGYLHFTQRPDILSD